MLSLMSETLQRHAHENPKHSNSCSSKAGGYELPMRATHTEHSTCCLVLMERTPTSDLNFGVLFLFFFFPQMKLYKISSFLLLFNM